MSANITLKVSREIKEFQGYEKLVEGFRQPLGGQTPGFLGREVAYNHPHTPPTVKQFLRHLHLCVPLDEHPLWWKQVTDRFRRTNPKKAPEKDYALVYGYDDLQDTYYLLTIIGPDAHNQAKWRSYLKDLAIEAERLLTRSSAFHQGGD